MTDLRDRLQRALGDDYRLERELAGGMSRVFVAEETRLGRRVVVKVLPPELVGGVNGGRFEREIRVAARLQHPHIVPLLSAGTQGDLVWYLMPWIDGESLRARLDRDGELPLDEATRLLGEVVDGLAYAHSSGVVHRDIKPANILLSGGHAIIADFGVARAVNEATGDSRLTSTGVALGTPAYMAPEQIAADVTIDSRADIYAVGALAFELFTGLVPFRGATTQAILAAHMTQPAPSTRTIRGSIPAALDAVILKCLEKRPADRWQTAKELLNELKATSTQSASAAHAVVRPSVPSTIRSTLRAAVLFAGAAVVVLAATLVLVNKLGLPDWVTWGAALLLVTGLPIILQTSRRERARAAGAAARSGRWNHLFTWRRAIMGGVAAFAGLGLLSAAFMTSRALGIGPGATLRSSGVLGERERIVLAPFENRTADSTLGPTVTQLVRIDLSQSPSLSVMEPAQVIEVLRRMQHDPATALTPELAREVAVRENLKAYVAGEILPAGSDLVVIVRLISAVSGDALVQVRQSVDSADELVEAVDRLSAKLREEVGESLRSVRAELPLEQVTTSSLKALRLYAEATTSADRGGYDDAIPLLREAVAADSMFAAAWRRLGTFATNAGQGPMLAAMGDSALRRAYALRDRLPERERWLIEGTSATSWDLAAQAYQKIVDRYPDDVTALNNLAVSYDRMGQFTRGMAALNRALATGQASAVMYDNMIGWFVNRGELSAGDSVLRLMSAAYPRSNRLTPRSAEILIQRGDFGGADSIAQAMLRATPAERAMGHRVRSMIAELHGQFGEADREYVSSLRVDEGRGQISAEEARLLAALVRLEREADYTSNTAAALRELNRLQEQNLALTRGRPVTARRYQLFPRLFAIYGDTATASRLAYELSRAVTDRDIPAALARMAIALPRATAANAAGRPDDALRLIREACARLPEGFPTCDAMVFLPAAEAHERAGRPDSALAVYRRFIAHQGLRHFAPPGSLDLATPRIAPAWRRVGELLEEKGDRTGAIEAYQRFLDLWKDADAELQPIVRSVQQRVDRLRRASG
ncbi:MAG: protein kinase domain-containing protein [Gemmatimonadota bacterium]